MYRVNYGRDGESLKCADGRFKATPKKILTFDPGQFHHVAAGSFHETLIDSSRLVATLMISGTAELSDHSLLSEDISSEAPWERPDLSDQQFAVVIGQILSSM